MLKAVNNPLYEGDYDDKENVSYRTYDFEDKEYQAVIIDY